MRWFALGSCCFAFSLLANSAAAEQSAAMADREKLDRTVWSQEVEAQSYERRIVQLWDELREKKDGDSLEVLARFPLESIQFGNRISRDFLELGIERIRFDAADAESKMHLYNAVKWRDLVRSFDAQGFRVVESEWHHSSFVSGKSPESIVDFVLHVVRRQKPGAIDPGTKPEIKKLDSPQRYVVKGSLRIYWQGDAAYSKANKIEVGELDILSRSGGPVFQEAFVCRRRERDVASAHPIIVHDLDRNGLPEIIISRWNRIYWNQGKGRFVERPMLRKPVRVAEVGLIADFTRDGQSDFLTVNKSGSLVLFRGNRSRDEAISRDLTFFPDAHEVVSDVPLNSASVITAGDVDRDGDVDVFVAQYKPAYQQGQMPTPYYDANDGVPAYLLLNDGAGKFVDATIESGLTSKRNRRTYSASLVDIDGDRDLDLVRVSDYAGVDLYENDGAGKFTDATAKLGANRHLFGMAHAFGDYNLDASLDLYAIGMSSTTARRLDGMKLGRDDRADIHKMRAAMGFGNRMYLGNGNGGFKEPRFAAQVARTGWSWGTTAFDYDLDGDEDIYVANGFRSGDSCEDYCSTFWRHDIYTGSSETDLGLERLFAKSMLKLNQRSISWNGYEHNALLQNLGGKQFANTAFLMGVGCEFDSRSVIGTDLDGDGRQDLIVSDYEFVGRGFISTIHVYRNTLKTKNNWIGFRVYDGGVKSGLNGATAELLSQGQRQVRQLVTGDSFASQHDNVFHFGLGESDHVEQVTIRLPNGEEQVLKDVAVNKYHGLNAE